MKIAIFEIEPWEHESFEHFQKDHEVVFERDPLDEDTVADYRDADVISTFIYSEVKGAVLDQLDRVGLIATRSTGVDHIDAGACEERGIKVANVPTYGENTVAEHVFALLLTISHHMVKAVDRTRRGDYSQQGLTGFDLQGRTMGVIGTGNIGRHTARIARGFGMEVVATDVKPDEELAREIGFEYLAMNELLARSDVISVHVPGGPKTRDMLGRQELEAVREGAVLINTSRGSVVNVEALLRALASGRLAAAGLDVLPEEPVVREEAELLRATFSRQHDLETLLADHALMRLQNVVLTPHSAFNTREAIQRILDTTRDNIESYLQEAPQNVVVG